MGLLMRIMIIGAIIYFFILPLFLGGYNAVLGFFWWVRP